MLTTQLKQRGSLALLCLICTLPAFGQSLRVQCPGSTPLHPDAAHQIPGKVYPGQIKCQQVAGTDGFATMGDGTQTYLFGFGPLSGIDLISKGLPGTLPADQFNAQYNNPDLPGMQVSMTDGSLSAVPDPLYDPSLPINTTAAVANPAGMMNAGVLSAQQPAPLVAIDEDDELFLTLSNVGMIMRPDLFEQHTIHFHGYPNASTYFDGVPDVSVAVNISGSMTYYYTAPPAGTYFWHCHITPPEHLQMGMIGQLYVRPRQNRVAVGANLHDALAAHNTATNSCTSTDPDWLTCDSPLPPANTVVQTTGAKYAYDDGDGSTRYDVEYPIMVMGFDPNFHWTGMTFNAEDFSGMKDKYFLLNGRSYPDTVQDEILATGPAGDNLRTQDPDGLARSSQPVRTHIIIDRSKGQTRALLRISDLSTTEVTTLATVGIPMTVIAKDSRMLRDLDGNNLFYNTNSITMGGGSTMDVILDASDTLNIPAGTYFLYTTNLDHLSNDNENFGGEMTEITVIGNTVVAAQ
ncbi:MAG: multicopper oxidase domain-containing protein [Gammaproteobacteria bacterium]|nr:multicopper oxidase domain-containing protein [Gammaproteobacteria bacterium]